MTDATRTAFHLLNRMGYGPRPGEVDALAKGGDPALQAWISQQLHPEAIADPAVETKLKDFKLLPLSIEQLHSTIPNRMNADADRSPEKAPRRMLLELVSQKLIRSVESKRQFQEVLADFWFNHFNVDFSKGQVKWYLIPYERDVIRPRMFGKFRELLGAVAKSPAMLFYLDNFQSVRDGLMPPGKPRRPDKPVLPKGLNENYGRELLELHTLGVDGGYTQSDVRETARALTGWSLEQPRDAAEYRFRPRAHDPDAKHILNLALPAGGGEDDGERVLDMLARHPSTAHFIAKKLCVKFISDHPPETAVQRLATVFQKTDGDLRAVYKELFALPEFWSDQARRSKIKTPWEYLVSASRALGSTIQVPPRGPLRVVKLLEQLGEPLYRCQPPTGFRATAENWVNPGALVTRINFGLALAGDRFPEIDIDRGSFRKKLLDDKVHELDASIDRLVQWVLQGEMAEPTRKRLERELDADEKVVDENSPEHHMTVNLSKMIGLVVGSPEFQRR